MKIVIAVVEPCDPTHPGHNLDISSTAVGTLPFLEISCATSGVEQEVGFDRCPPDADVP